MPTPQHAGQCLQRRQPAFQAGGRDTKTLASPKQAEDLRQIDP